MAVVPNETHQSWHPLPAILPLPTEQCLEELQKINQSIEDLNRIALASICEVLPEYRKNKVNLIARLSSVPLNINTGRRSREQIVSFLLRQACFQARDPSREGTVIVETTLNGDSVELCATIIKNECQIKEMISFVHCPTPSLEI